MFSLQVFHAFFVFDLENRAEFSLRGQTVRTCLFPRKSAGKNDHYVPHYTPPDKHSEHVT